MPIEGRLLNYIGGRWQRSSAADYLEVTNPATAEGMAEVPLSPSAEVAQAVEAAAAAFERSDVCAVPAASVIAEAMVAIALAEASLDLFGGASLDDFVARGQAHAARAAAIRGGSESP